jgi:hypothetical protein
MTTGRINQVTTFQATLAGAFCIGVGIPKDTFPDGSSSRPRPFHKISQQPRRGFPVSRRTRHSILGPVTRSPCTLDLTSLRDTSPRLDQTRIEPFKGDYQRPAAPWRHARSRRIPTWLIASGLAIGKQSTSPFVADERFKRAPSDLPRLR